MGGTSAGHRSIGTMSDYVRELRRRLAPGVVLQVPSVSVAVREAREETGLAVSLTRLVDPPLTKRTIVLNCWVWRARPAPLVSCRSGPARGT
jgi:8-oxo-dGTP pyrophosphatase MutT (NUDIX family)